MVQTSVPPGTTDVALLRALAVEHACRATDDVALVDHLTRAAPQSRAAVRALGRLLEQSPVSVRSGTPLSAWVRGGPVHPHWRDECRVRPGSIAFQVDMMQQVLGPVNFPGVMPDPDARQDLPDMLAAYVMLTVEWNSVT